MDDYYCVEEYSDNEVIDSSDDEDFKSLFTCIVSEDEDFETEMERERLSHVNGLHKPDPNARSAKSTTKTEEQESETNSTKNDELLYDPTSDENDQKWVDSQRPKKKVVASSGQSSSSSRPLNSDATLNCPACMALLCLDCQRHETYRTQYRAMFVFNCRIDFTEKFQYKQKKRKRNNGRNDINGVDEYYSVLCDQCNTQVAVYDTDQVYHFFGVLASF